LLIAFFILDLIVANLALIWMALGDDRPTIHRFWMLAHNRPPATALQADAVATRPARVILAAVDGLSWQIVADAVDRGQLPNLKRLIERGGVGLLHSYFPFMSPEIWTTIATGVPPSLHGVTDILNERGYFFSTDERRAKAVWNVLGDMGKKVGVAGWLVSFPAEKVNGVYIADRGDITPLVSVREGRLRELQTYPPEDLDRIADLIQAYQPADALFQRERKPNETLGNEMMRVWMRWPRSEMIRWMSARDAEIAAISTRIWTNDQPDFLAYYTLHTDTASHYYYLQRSKVVAAYQRFDEALGKLLAHADERTLVIVCSDHGFRSIFRPPLTQMPLTVIEAFWSGFRFIGEHDPDGVLIAAGPGVPTGSAFASADVYDLAPTILRAFGLPPLPGMPGKALIPYPLAPALSYPPGYTILTAPKSAAETAFTEQENQAVKERLRSIGYLR
jgi:predicted AlkP superfamily phosphohydrolase/phosphomutase